MNLITILILGWFAQQTPIASIEGTVVQIGTAQPIAKAIVELSGGGGRSPLVLETNADGKFAFQNLVPGRYNLKVSRGGYLENPRGRSISMNPGQAMKDIRIALVPLGTLSGRVFDSAGEPLVNVSVRALKYSYDDGRRLLKIITTDKTDDRGEFRLFWLPPGQYYVSAVPQGRAVDDGHMLSFLAGGQPLRLDADGVPQIGAGYEIEKLGDRYVPVYYPGTADLEAASALVVQPGSDFNGVNFTIPRTTPRKVRGIAVDGATGQTVRMASVTLVSRTASTVAAVAARGRGTSDGTFEFQSVFPGSYYAVATSRIPVGGGAVRIVGGRTAVDVGNADVDRLVVIMSPSMDIIGQVTVGGIVDNAAAGKHPIVALRNDTYRGPDVWAAFRELFASFNTADQFVINDAIDSDYRVDVTDLPSGTYLKSIRFGATDLADGILHLDPRSSDRIEIVLGTNVGAMEGIVTDKDRRPLANTTVAVVPDAALRQRLDLYKSATTDESGRFRLEGIAPADYLIFAWEEIEDRLWLDPDFIGRNAASGRRIRVSERSRENVELLAIPFAY
jgi:Carboxypeptidase regulatory-like domain